MRTGCGHDSQFLEKLELYDYGYVLRISRNIIYPGVDTPNYSADGKLYVTFLSAVLEKYRKVLGVNKKVTIRETGIFYTVFDDDAKIISYFFDYKLKNGSVGFPKNAINKVTNLLEDKKIDYEVIGKDAKNMTFKKLNNYNKFMAKAIAKNDVVKIIDDMKYSLDKMSEEELHELLNNLQGVVNGTK